MAACREESTRHPRYRRAFLTTRMENAQEQQRGLYNRTKVIFEKAPVPFSSVALEEFLLEAGGVGMRVCA